MKTKEQVQEMLNRSKQSLNEKLKDNLMSNDERKKELRLEVSLLEWVLEGDEK